MSQQALVLPVATESGLERAVDVFRKLLLMTPEPPSNVDASILVSLGAEMVEARQTELAILRLILGENPEVLLGHAECRGMRDELVRRNERWDCALKWAKNELSKRRHAAQRARQAQRAYR